MRGGSGLFFIMIFVAIKSGAAPRGTPVPCPIQFSAVLRDLSLPRAGADSEMSAALNHLSQRFDRIRPELGISRMDFKLKKQVTEALIAIDLDNGGRVLLPEAEVHLENLLERFQGSPPLEHLAASYTTSRMRGEMGEAVREAQILLQHLSPEERKFAAGRFGLHPPEDSYWAGVGRDHRAVVEKVVEKDLQGKEHAIYVLLGHPEGAKSSMERFHAALKRRYGSELYINDDLVPSSLGFYQAIPEGQKGGTPYIILRSQNLKNDFLDYVGYHEGRHVMFKEVRRRLEAVDPVEVQIEALPGHDLPPWYSRKHNAPIPELEEARRIHARDRNSYKKFMTYEENYNHAKDLKYAQRIRHDAVLELFQKERTLPANRIFDLGLIEDKIDLLDEITHKTKETSLLSRLKIEKQFQIAIRELEKGAPDLSFLDGLKKESLKMNMTEGYAVRVLFSTAPERKLTGEVLQRRKWLEGLGAGADPAEVQRAREALSRSLTRMQEHLSQRLIDSHDFALTVKGDLFRLEQAYEPAVSKGRITEAEYRELRESIFAPGKSAQKALFTNSPRSLGTEE